MTSRRRKTISHADLDSFLNELNDVGCNIVSKEFTHKDSFDANIENLTANELNSRMNRQSPMRREGKESYSEAIPEENMPIYEMSHENLIREFCQVNLNLFHPILSHPYHHTFPPSV